MTEYFQITSGNWFFHFVIGLLLFLPISWVVGKVFARRKVKLIVALLSTLILTPITYYFLFLVYVSILFYEYHPESNFDQVEWNENIIDRHEMKKDIIESKLLIGKTKNETVEILGSPKQNFAVEKDTLNTWTYSLGNEGHGLGLKFHYLTIDFADGKVKEITTKEIID